jgi:hypothetical protein
VEGAFCVVQSHTGAVDGMGCHTTRLLPARAFLFGQAATFIPPKQLEVRGLLKIVSGRRQGRVHNRELMPLREEVHICEPQYVTKLVC